MPLLLLAAWSASVGALDLTGTWEGQWHCSVQVAGVPDHVSNPASTMKISQAGNTLGVEIDGPLFRYNGLAQADSTDPDIGAATFISCRTDTSLVNPAGYNELISADVATNPANGSGLVKATSTSQQFGAGAVAAVCRYTLKRVSSADPGVPANCAP